MKGNIFYAQSGGVTPVINSTAFGLIEHFYKNKKYFIASEKMSLSSTAMCEYLIKLCKKFPIFSIEDGMSEDDWKGWSYMSKNIPRKTLMIGDDLDNDIYGAKRIKVDGILVKTGKYHPKILEMNHIKPYGLFDSIGNLAKILSS